MTRIHSAAVLGAGTMGSQIAAHLANAGVPVLLLDLDRRTAHEGLKRAQALKPNPFFTSKTVSLISLGGFDQDLKRIADCDWIIEAIVEHLDTKQQLLARVEPFRSSNSIVSSNTSGIPIASIAHGRSKEFRQHWLGTHFFNPPRYLSLLEVIPTSDTDPAVVDTISRFGDRVLGKGIVVAKDTPNFIGNRIGLYGVIRAIEQWSNGTFTIEEIDAMSGPAIGRPKSATFRTMDIAGIDILAHVAKNITDRLERDDERLAFSLPPLIDELVARGWVGEKAGQGFYKKERGHKSSRILTLDQTTMSYRDRQTPQLSPLEAAQSIDDPADRIRTLFLSKNQVGEFIRATLGKTLLYAAQVTPTIAHSIDDVDRAMRWGFGWKLGPFELWDIIGIDTILTACEVDEAPPLIQELPLLAHPTSSGAPKTKRFRDGLVPPSGTDLQILRSSKERRGVVSKNACASLVDLSDGVLALEFHSKMNVLSTDTVEMMNLGIHTAERDFDALVIGNDSVIFSAGANLTLVLLHIQEENWKGIELLVKGFQSAITSLRYSKIPVIVAPAGLTLGGGCEVALHGDRVQAAAETYMGQVEVGVGLVPAGGGTKELLVRSMDRMPERSPNALPYVQHAFELVGFAKVSTSGQDAVRLGLLRDVDGFTMNRDRLMADAKAAVLELVRRSYQPPQPRQDIPVGGDSLRATLNLGIHLARQAGHISDHDALIGQKLTRILTGGDLPHPSLVSETYLLDLEREAFLSLCGEKKTQERMRHTLESGKPLRN